MTESLARAVHCIACVKSHARPLSSRAHGYLDYLVVLWLSVAPFVGGFSGRAAGACYVVAMLHFAVTLLTAEPLGLVKLIRFRMHGALELVTSLFLVAMPWLVGFYEIAAARNIFVATGIGVAVLWFVTDYAHVELPVYEEAARSARESAW